MKNIWILTKTNIRRNRLGILISAGGALILCVMLFSMGIAVKKISLAKVAVGVIDYDQSILSEDFKNYLEQQLDYQLVEQNDYDSLSAELIDKHISVIIEIPEKFYDEFLLGNRKEIILTSLDDFENSVFVEAYINSYLSSIRVLAEGASKNEETFRALLKDYHDQEIQLTQESVFVTDSKEQDDKAGFINSIGFYLLISFSISIIVSFMILDDRIRGIYGRIQITPVKPFQYLIGTGIFGLFLCILQIGIYIFYLCFKQVEIGVSIPILFTMMTLYAFFVLAFSVAIALALPTKNSITAVVIGFSSIGCIMGGAYFSLDLVPEAMQKLARIFPQFWVMDALRRLQEDAAANIYSNIIILSLYTILCVLCGAVLFSKNYKNR